MNSVSYEQYLVYMNPHTRWIVEVRDPATHLTEGLRTVSRGDGCVTYELAPLPCGRVAALLGIRGGNYGGSSSPWKPFETRAMAIQYVIEESIHYFKTYCPNPELVIALEELRSPGANTA